jgi:F-type H+-transporting ATPase subunit b
MEATLAALGGLLIRALPTFLIILALHLYLKHIFFKPMKRVLDERYAATEGAREKAQQSLERASAKAREYEDAIRAARAEIYQAQEQAHRRLEEQRSLELQAARARADAAVRKARAGLAEEVESARRTLDQETAVLADRIVETVLGRRVA